MDLITIVTAIVGSVGGASGILTLFTLRQKRESIAIESLTKVINEVRENHDLFKKESHTKIAYLEKRLNALDLKDKLQTQSISKGYNCEHLRHSTCKNTTCPIIADFTSSLKAIEEINKKKNIMDEV